MRLTQTLAVLASLALVMGAQAAVAQCSAETECVATGCSEAYGSPAADFPYAVDYTTTGDSITTTFRIKVCSTPCEASDPLCKPLKTFRLRLADDVLAAPTKFIKSAMPTGRLAGTCPAPGPGWFIPSADLLSLATSDPSKGETCEVFSVSVYNSPEASEPMALRQLCQQDVQIVGEGGEPVFTQDGASCLFTFELSTGVSGVGQVDQRSPPEPESPSPPAARPSPSTPSPSPVPSPSPKPVPSPSPSPKPSPGPRPYYGGERRRLQQAPFVRSLLTSYYGPSAHRRLASLDSESVAGPLAFATRRLMEASVVPLPHLLADFHPASVSAPTGRTLASYYGSHRRLHSLESTGRTLMHGDHGGYYGEHRRSLMSTGGYYGSHRRSLMSAGSDTIIGRSLLHGDHGGYYGEHRRSLMSAGSESMTGRSLLHGDHGGYYGEHRRSLMSAGGYYGSHRRTLSVDGQGAAVGRALLHAGYYGHRRLSSYYGSH